jgi:hypothetical protein
MEETKVRQKPGRKPVEKSLKRKIVTAYLTDAEKAEVNARHGNLTNLVKNYLKQN